MFFRCSAYTKPCLFSVSIFVISTVLAVFWFIFSYFFASDAIHGACVCFICSLLLVYLSVVFGDRPIQGSHLNETVRYRGWCGCLTPILVCNRPTKFAECWIFTASSILISISTEKKMFNISMSIKFRLQMLIFQQWNYHHNLLSNTYLLGYFQSMTILDIFR